MRDILKSKNSTKVPMSLQQANYKEYFTNYYFYGILICVTKNKDN